MTTKPARGSRKHALALKSKIFYAPELMQTGPALPSAPLPDELAGQVVPLEIKSGSRSLPQLGSFGVLVLVLDMIASQRSADLLARYGQAWQNREVVFLSAANIRVGTQMGQLFPKLFYNTGEPLALHTVWRLLPWRVVVVIKAGKASCWTPNAPAPHASAKTQVLPNAQPPKESK